MKKLASILTCLVTIFSLCSYVYAEDEEIKVYLEGTKINFDVQPQTINDRTMVPIRAIFEAMGAVVEWNDSTQTAISTKDNTTVKMTLNSTTEYINDKALEMDVTPVIINGRTLAPARYVAEAFGYYVNWDEMTKSVLISKDAHFDISQIKDGSRKHPYKFGDKATVNVYKIFASEPKATFDITLKKLLSPEEMEKTINNSEYYTYDKDTWYLNCDVSLLYYEEDAAYTFSDMIIFDAKFVTSTGKTVSNVFSLYSDPSNYSYLELFEGASSECYIPIKTDEIADGDTVDYFTITTTLPSDPETYSYKKKTIWFSLK